MAEVDHDIFFWAPYAVRLRNVGDRPFELRVYSETRNKGLQGRRHLTLDTVARSIPSVISFNAENPEYSIPISGHWFRRIKLTEARALVADIVSRQPITPKNTAADRARKLESAGNMSESQYLDFLRSRVERGTPNFNHYIVFEVSDGKGIRVGWLEIKVGVLTADGSGKGTYYKVSAWDGFDARNAESRPSPSCYYIYNVTYNIDFTAEVSVDAPKVVGSVEFVKRGGPETILPFPEWKNWAAQGVTRAVLMGASGDDARDQDRESFYVPPPGALVWPAQTPLQTHNIYTPELKFLSGVAGPVAPGAVSGTVVEARSEVEALGLFLSVLRRRVEETERLATTIQGLCHEISRFSANLNALYLLSSMATRCVNVQAQKTKAIHDATADLHKELFRVVHPRQSVSRGGAQTSHAGRDRQGQAQGDQAVHGTPPQCARLERRYRGGGPDHGRTRDAPPERIL